MIATITTHAQSRSMSPPISLNMNSAGAPLPLIPRRITSVSRARARSAPSSPPDKPSSSSSLTPIKVVVHHSTPPLGGADSDTSSSSSSSSSSPQPDPMNPPRPKRIRAVRSAAVRPPEQSTPTPAVHEARLEHHRAGQPLPATADDTTPRRPASMIYTPGISLRLATEHLKKPRNVSESSASSTTLTTSQSQPRLIRKKSGQLVKSSLKSSKSLSVVTSASTCGTLASSKSEPNTPSAHAKAVHFDAQLEHVKLFLAEQKPLAVSRDGSPTEDTSGTDTDFPSFVFGQDTNMKAQAQQQRRNLVMHTPNVPRHRNLNADVVLESLALAPEALSILGHVRVRNIAYAKSVVARFTFDAWQTTSEVSARYASSPSPEVDVFVFTIRINDMVSRIEGKRMWLAVKYVVGEREMWDNNAGRDYLAEFEVAKAPAPMRERERERVAEWERSIERGRERGLPRGRSSDESSSSSSSAVAESDIADLRTKLEKVVVRPMRPSPAPSLSSTTSTSSMVAPMTTLRYDFATGASSAHTWVPPISPARTHGHSRQGHVRTQSYPASSYSSYSSPQRPAFHPTIMPFRPNSIPWPEKGVPAKIMTPPLGSPRDIGEDGGADALFAAAKQGKLVGGAADEDEDVTFVVAPIEGGGGGRERNHRRGYFASAYHHHDGEVKRTLLDEGGVETETTPMPGRFYSFPQAHLHPRPRGLGIDFSAAAVYGPGLGDSSTASESSELSTPSLGSSRETSPSPEGMELGLGWEEKKERERERERGMSVSPSENYKEFLSRFCFFTGSHQLPPYPDSTDSDSLNAHSRAHTHPHPHLTRKTFIDVPRSLQPQPQPLSPSKDVLVASPSALSPSPSPSPSMTSLASIPSPGSGDATPTMALSPSCSNVGVNVVPGPITMPGSVMFGPKAVAV
ncbi:putative starch/carbohydrate-binding module (family 53) [Lyophyllum shimeji]|uniref:Starch/carbohydrate-binding module (Family 53) n=1 Tax=Lyophyllum shimeji TaxID=47721 RepID=A0A9P3UIH8_LYOSH|nr:putative starch/carbohydrate-binding module (family 53) [Lyophyllum shimeji]